MARSSGTSPTGNSAAVASGCLLFDKNFEERGTAFSFTTLTTGMVVRNSDSSQTKSYLHDSSENRGVFSALQSISTSYAGHLPALSFSTKGL